MKSIFILILLLIGILSQLSYAQSLENELTISISPDGKARVTETLNTPTTISSINTKLISNKISNLLTIDENNIFLSNSQNGNQLRIDSLGASHVTLSYDADIIKNDLGIWRVSYTGNLQSTVILPPLSNILSVNNIPLDIVDDVIIMPPGQISISYTIREVTTQNFPVYSDGLSHTIQIMTGSQIDSFKHDLGMISFNVDDDVPVLIIIPNSLSSGPFEILLNEKLIEHQNYFQNDSTWIRVEPQESGVIKIIEEIPVIEEIPIIEEIPTKETSQSSKGGGCLIATATYGTELAPQIQFLREIRDGTIMSTSSGAAFMTGFNQLYYSFSPTIADIERENPMFREIARSFITPMISTLSIMTLAEDGSEVEVLGLGISVIALNLGMYIVAPAIVVWQVRKRF